MDQQNNHQQPMKVENTTCACGAGCNCGCGYRPGYHILRWLLGLFILFCVFALGVKLGEFLTELRYSLAGANRADMMMHIRGGQEGFNPGGPMIPAEGTSSAAY
jgi:hypothetical protein